MVRDDYREDLAKPNFDFSAKTQSSASTAAHRLAHPLDRMAAFLVDVAILFLLTSLAIAPLQKKIKAAQLINNTESLILWVLLLFLVLGTISVIYSWLMHSIFLGTVGKRLFQIQVVDVWTGRAAKSSDYFVRAVLWWFDSITALPHFAMYSDPMRRTFHDRVSNTIVVSVSRRVGLPPLATESALIKYSLLCVYMLGFVFLVDETRMAFNLVESDQESSILSMVSPVMCESVTNAQSDWPLEKGDVASRISIALALFAAGAVDEECLNQEAFLAFRANENKTLAYLARAFATSDDSELSDRYLEKVCELDPDSEACEFSGLISLWTEKSWAEASEGFHRLIPNAHVFVKTWGVKHFEKVKDYASEIKLIDSLWPNEGLSEFLASHRAVALWGVDRKEESRVALQGAVENMGKSKQLGLTSWICYHELENGCGVKDVPGCQRFETLVEENPIVLSHELFALTQLRLMSCQESPDFKDFVEGIDDENIVKLVQSVNDIKNGKVETAIRRLEQVQARAERSSVLFHDVTQRLAKLSSEKLDEAIEHWGQSQQTDLWDWKSLGEFITTQLLEQNRHREVIQVSGRILNQNAYSKIAKESLVVSAYELGQVGLAKKWMDSIEGKNSRMPASQDRLEKVREALRSQ